MSLTPQATIDLNALRHNLQQARQHAPDSRVMAAVKADAYGHGLTQAAASLDQADGLATAHLEEAVRLREAGYPGRLLVMSARLDANGLDYCARHRIDIVVHTAETVDLLCHTPLPAPLAIWFKHDSGMHRLGLDDRGLQDAVQTLSAAGKLADSVYMTHFSGSDAPQLSRTRDQIERFERAIAPLPPAPRSLANSAAVIRGNPGNSDWIRPGIMLYGANPLHESIVDDYPVDLKPVMTLTAPVIAVRRIAAGESVGYNSRWTAARDSVIATIGIGYGDGYPRHAIDGTPVLIRGRRLPLAGIVSMDMLTVDITQQPDIEVGDTATLWGDGLPAEVIAERAGTITYELFTQVTARVRRVYVG